MSSFTQIGNTRNHKEQCHSHVEAWLECINRMPEAQWFTLLLKKISQNNGGQIYQLAMVREWTPRVQRWYTSIAKCMHTSVHSVLNVIVLIKLLGLQSAVLKLLGMVISGAHTCDLSK